MADQPVDIDAVIGEELWPERPSPFQQTSDVPENEPEPRPEKPEPTPEDQLLAMVFRSKHGGRGHVVSVLEWRKEGVITRGVLCNCEAAASLARRPAGCWAMKYARDLLGLEEPTT